MIGKGAPVKNRTLSCRRVVSCNLAVPWLKGFCLATQNYWPLKLYRLSLLIFWLVLVLLCLYPHNICIFVANKESQGLSLDTILSQLSLGGDTFTYNTGERHAFTAVWLVWRTNARGTAALVQQKITDSWMHSTTATLQDYDKERLSNLQFSCKTSIRPFDHSQHGATGIYIVLYCCMSTITVECAWYL